MTAGQVTITDWSAVSEYGRRRRFNPGEYLCVEGANDKTVFALIAGVVRVVVVTRSGARVVIAERGPGELVGEMAVLDDGPRSAAVVARTPVEAYVLTPEGFTALLGAQPQLSLQLLTSLATRLRELTNRVATRSSDIECRLAERLLLLADSEETDLISVTQQDLAEWVDATREAVARVLAGFRSDGLVVTSRGTVELNDRLGLASLLS